MKTGSLENGMAFVTGYWYASDMNWLDGDECGSGPEHCNQNPAYISNWRITTNSASPSPSPSPSPHPSPSPAPAPHPSPSPAPAPLAGGKCCYQHCNDCHEEGSWCGASADNCRGHCGGGVWC
mmetsp:Transcript_53225/g.137640  ORF Transcript_53225/g.137640 Transcript_53225/m.137640 type:complete len:123 (+) Transcript_53225:2-370(+)